jgi:hypothetical protein
LTKKDDDVHPVQETTTACQGMCDRRPDVFILDVRIDNDVTYRLALRDKIQGARHVSACWGGLRLKPYGKDQRL